MLYFCHMILVYVLTVFFLIVLDLLWLGKIAKPLYHKEVGSLMRPEVFWTPALLFYLLFPIGLLVFVITPSAAPSEALWRGIFFGFIVYSTYNLTNLSLIQGWTKKVTIVDTLWGSILCGALSVLIFRLAQSIL